MSRSVDDRDPGRCESPSRNIFDHGNRDRVFSKRKHWLISESAAEFQFEYRVRGTADASRLERVPPTARRRRRARVRASTHLALTLLDGLSASFSSRTAAPLRHTAWGPRRTRHTWVALARPRRVGAWHAAHRRGRPLSSSPSSGHQRVVRRVCTDAPLMLSLTCRRQTFRHRRRYVGPS